MATADDSISVLHVDHDSALSDLTATYSERQNNHFDVTIVADAEEGIECLADGQFDCIVSDHEKPEQNDLDFLRSVREEYPDIPFVLFIGEGSEEVASTAISIGVTDYLRKPAQDDQYSTLADRIQHVVNDRRESVQRRDRVETIFEHTQDALFLITVDNETFRVQRVNRAYKELTGLSTEDVQGKSPAEILNDEQATKVEAQYRECIDRREPIKYDEKLTIGDETRFWHTRLAPVIESGEVTQLVGATRDITENKRRIAETTELKQQYKTVCESIPNGAVFLFDDDLRYVRARGTELEVVGLSPEEIEGKTPRDVFPDGLADGLVDHFTRALDGDAHTFTQMLGDSTYRNQVSPVEDSGGEARYGIALAQNVTEQVARKKRLKAQNQRLEQFAGVVSHDLRNPLQTALGRLELVERECESEYVEDVERALNRIDTLITDLLMLARQGEPIGETEPVDLAAAVETCCHNIEVGEPAVEVNIERQIDADQSRLAQLLENLIKNAIEHCGSEVRITVGELDNGFYIADDGPGIPKSERDTVFDAGYSSTDTGTGFGLSIVKEIVDAHGWDIHLTTGIDGGARFEITGVEFTD
jgi:PAS domain S-box-containing protein